MSNETSRSRVPTMGDQERVQLAFYFDDLATRLHALLVEIGEQGSSYPGLRSSDNYLTMRGYLEESVHHSEDLADYIRHTNDENWKQEPHDTDEEPSDIL